MQAQTRADARMYKYLMIALTCKFCCICFSNVRPQDEEQIAKAKLEEAESSNDKAKLLDNGNGAKYQAVEKP